MGLIEESKSGFPTHIVQILPPVGRQNDDCLRVGNFALANFLFQLFVDVAHLFAFDLQVALEGFFGFYRRGDAFDYADACRFKSLNFFRIVGDEAHCVDAELLQDFCWELKFAAVGLVAELDVGFYCVESLILEFVGFQFRHQADAAALLLLVEEDACACFRDGPESQFELQSAIAAQGVEDISGKALRVDADDGRLGVDIAHDEGHCALDSFHGSRRVGVARFGIGDDAFESEDAEMAPACGEIGIGNLSYAFKRHRFHYTNAGDRLSTITKRVTK